MSSTPFSALACPLDGNPMQLQGGTWHCDAGHGFDVARQGYTHLLPVQHKRSRDPGDSKAMVAARQRFLNAGHYRPVADAVARAALSAQPDEGALRCLDAGCGEGYYLRCLAEAAREQDAALSLLGLDISKWAVLSAARQERAMSRELQEGAGSQWVVASNARLPVQDGTLDCVLSLFGFPVYSQFARVLAPKGILIQAEVGPDHLRELREIIYPSLKPEREPSQAAPDGLVRREVETIRFPLALGEPQAIADLLAMTPHLYRASAEGRDRAAALDSLSVTVDIRLTQFVRLADARV
ncbi:putative RNA methyltransferase [Salinicola acroporae]|uniref:rRNA (Guanine-N1)-methyltransferase n=1 Tax=Salinicola acroporae TaxID=1541440 RepID=A0ABT6I8V7_9GAMM|nr:methyltransferase domain-containing protein [Salinicola acroporae]MDH4574046.1 rRNA (guanine-N1)-methyltransferase [Salinicola acroporae]